MDKANAAFGQLFKAHVYASLLVSQLAVFSGFTKSFSSILLPALQSNESLIQITVDQASTLAAFGTLCRPLGALLSGPVIEKFGRKTGVQIAFLLHTVSWMIITVSPSYFCLNVGRLITSLASGLENASYMYISEISPVTVRGPLLGLAAPMTSVGTSFVFALGSFLSWRLISLVFSIYALLLFALLFLFHESPTFHLLKNDRQKAIQGLTWLRNDNKAAVNAEIEEMENKLTKHETLCGLLKSLTHPSVWYPFIMLAILSILIGCSGEVSILSYTVTFFSLFNSNYSDYVLSIIFAFISLIGSLCMLFFSGKMDRTMVLMVSGVGMSVSLTLAAVFYLFGKSDWTILLIFAYIFSSSFGMTSVPYMISAEIYPGHVRGVMTSLTCVCMFVPATINTKLFPTLIAFFHPFGLLMYFAIFSLLAALFAKIFVPETRNKSMFHITEYFEKK